MDRTGTNMNSRAIGKELERTLIRYKAGLVSLQQARQELALLQAMLRAHEQAVIEEKLDRIEATLQGRR